MKAHKKLTLNDRVFIQTGIDVFVNLKVASWGCGRF